MIFKRANSFLKRLFPFFGKSYIYLSDQLAFDLKNLSLRSIAPSLVIIGAQKSGTTTLANYLDKHKDIFLTKPMKEGGYYLDYSFMDTYFRTRGKKVYGKYDYIKNFTLKGYQGEDRICDATTFYTLNNEEAKNSAIKNFNQTQKEKKIKFIYIIRNPYERLISHYKHLYRNSNELSFENFILTHHSKPLKVSQYAYQMDYYRNALKTFDCKVVFFEELVIDPQSVLNGLVSFLSLNNNILVKNRVHKNKSIRLEESKLLLTEKIKNKVISVLERDKQQLREEFNLSFPDKFSAIPKEFK